MPVRATQDLARRLGRTTSLLTMTRFVLVLLTLCACGPKLAPSEETRAIELELEVLLGSHEHVRRDAWRSVELDESRLAYIDVETPREGCHLLVVLTDGEGEILELRRDPHVSLGAPGLSWFAVCADDPGVRSAAATVVARAPMSRAIHLAIFRGPSRAGALALTESYLPEPAPTTPMVVAVAPNVAPAADTLDEPADASAAGSCGNDPRAAAAREYALGREAAEHGDLDRAAAAFDGAYACAPDGTILLNAAAMHARRGDAERAVERYERLLTEHGEGLTRVLRRQVDDALTALRRPVRVVVEAPRGALVTIEGVVLERGEGRVVPGTHTIAWQRGERRVTRDVVVRPGERLRVPRPEELR